MSIATPTNKIFASTDPWPGTAKVRVFASAQSWQARISSEHVLISDICSEINQTPLVPL